MTDQLVLDLAPSPPWRKLRREQARVLILATELGVPSPWTITEHLRANGLPLYERGCAASRCSELVRLGLLVEVGSVPSPFGGGRTETVYAVTDLGRTRLDEAREVLS